MKTKIFLLSILFTASSAYASCGSSFCSVNTHWDTQGLVNDSGLRIDLRYAYAKADTPRVGATKVARPLPSDPALAGAEVENLRTINQTLNMNLDYAFNPKWSIALDIPVIMRDHAHMIGAAAAPFVVEQRNFSQIGDVRALGNYKFDSDNHLVGSGIKFGLKLATGRFNLDMVPGTPLERSLQPGSGSTDLVLGAYYHQALADSPWGWFVSGHVQSAFTTKNNFRPGNDIALDIGTHYTLSSSLTGLLQFNADFKERDSGINANLHSGGHSLNISPGLSFSVTPQSRLYGFVQLPLYQYANTDPAGTPFGQLTAPWSVSIGISQIF